MLHALKEIPRVTTLLYPFMFKSLKAKREEHSEMSRAKARRRMEKQTGIDDFLSHLIDSEATIQEIYGNSTTLILAGSETTGTLLSGTTFYILKNPDVLAKLVEEVRTAFESEDQITITGVNKLTYMLACFNEGLRLYPPIPGYLPRRVPSGGAMINGDWVPEGVIFPSTRR
jgi:cytochrome P450